MHGDRSVCKREVGTLDDALCGGTLGSCVLEPVCESEATWRGVQ